MAMVRGVTTPGTARKPPGIADAAGLHHRAGIVDDRRGGPRDQTGGGLQRGFAEIGIADGVEDQLMRRQRQPTDRDSR